MCDITLTSVHSCCGEACAPRKMAPDVSSQTCLRWTSRRKQVGQCHLEGEGVH